MNKQQFEALSTEDKALADEAYRDGFNAAVEIVESCVQRIGDGRLDSIFIANRDSIVRALRMSLRD